MSPWSPPQSPRCSPAENVCTHVCSVPFWGGWVFRRWVLGERRALSPRGKTVSEIMDTDLGAGQRPWGHLGMQGGGGQEPQKLQPPPGRDLRGTQAQNASSAPTGHTLSLPCPLLRRLVIPLEHVCDSTHFSVFRNRLELLLGSGIIQKGDAQALSSTTPRGKWPRRLWASPRGGPVLVHLICRDRGQGRRPWALSTHAGRDRGAARFQMPREPGGVLTLAWVPTLGLAHSRCSVCAGGQ